MKNLLGDYDEAELHGEPLMASSSRVRTDISTWSWRRLPSWQEQEPQHPRGRAGGAVPGCQHARLHHRHAGQLPHQHVARTLFRMCLCVLYMMRCLCPPV